MNWISVESIDQLAASRVEDIVKATNDSLNPPIVVIGVGREFIQIDHVTLNAFESNDDLPDAERSHYGSRLFIWSLTEWPFDCRRM